LLTYYLNGNDAYKLKLFIAKWELIKNLIKHTNLQESVPQ
jgi:hypothetical protein